MISHIPPPTALDLYVGDVHARAEDLDDCQNLLDLILEKAQEHRARRIVFLGDQHHTHAIVHLEVIAFWRRNVKRLTDAGFDVVLMVGNHDMSGDASSTSHAMMAYESMPRVTVVAGLVDAPDMKLSYLGYQGSNEKFIEHCRSAPDRVIVCHAEFNGCQFENGFFSSTGVDVEDVPQTEIISGHIHAPQRLGKVWYLGSPRWLTVSDANQDRFIYLVWHNPFGRAEEVLAIPTGERLQRIYLVEDHFERPFEGEVLPQHRYVVDIVGPQSWIEDRRQRWTGRARIRTSRTDQQIIRLRESEGIEKALVKFAGEFNPPHGTPKPVLMNMVEQRLMEAK